MNVPTPGNGRTGKTFLKPYVNLAVTGTSVGMLASCRDGHISTRTYGLCPLKKTGSALRSPGRKFSPSEELTLSSPAFPISRFMPHGFRAMFPHTALCWIPGQSASPAVFGDITLGLWEVAGLNLS
jgi:hypothetical protein